MSAVDVEAALSKHSEDELVRVEREEACEHVTLVEAFDGLGALARARLDRAHPPEVSASSSSA
jgi:hypothetical protein